MSKRAEEAALRAYPVRTYRKDQGEPEYSSDYNANDRYRFKEGYEQAEKDLGWHSVKNALPPRDEEVIVLTDELNTAPIYKIAFGHIVNKDIAIDYDGWNIEGVRYWMPMPEIPEK